MCSDLALAEQDSGRSLAIVVLAAGLGTRMRSARAKVLHRLAGRPLIAWVLDAARSLRPDRLVVVVGHHAHEVEAACARSGTGGTGEVAAVSAAAHFVRQAVQSGTGDAVRCAAPALAGLAGDVLILYGDVPALRAETIAAFVASHRQAGAALSLLTACFPDPTGYGRIVRSPSGAIERIVEERDASPSERRIREINPGIYCVAADFLLAAVGELAADNAQGEYYLTDIVGLARSQGRHVWSGMVEDPEEVIGINTRAELANMEARCRRSMVERWMAAGVTFEDPETAYVGADVTIGRDTTIGPNTTLRASVIGEGCRIDGSAYLENARLGNRVHLKFGVVITDSEVGDDVQIGPFAHLRPGTRLAEGVRIGNFVETKKAILGRETKANHLSYLGDVTIGTDTNVGAGTITCNYDGFRKHQTVIGDRVQIGSDTQLVAPVEVGSDAYVGAGTTVTAPVAPGALVVSRVPQRQIPGWVSRRRAREAGGAVENRGTPGAAASARTKVQARRQTAGGTAGRPRPRVATQKLAKKRATKGTRRRAGGAAVVRSSSGRHRRRR
jgi:bifunctional UDP-N-acetylglucosamine pyrophosphorylase/glucosamine-1-phosphate N-acetyltransferase